MPPDHPGLSEEDVLGHGGWHPRYARVLAITSGGDYSFAVVDGNGDGAELEAEMWEWSSRGGGANGRPHRQHLLRLRQCARTSDGHDQLRRPPPRRAGQPPRSLGLHQNPHPPPRPRIPSPDSLTRTWGHPRSPRLSPPMKFSCAAAANDNWALHDLAMRRDGVGDKEGVERFAAKAGAAPLADRVRAMLAELQLPNGLPPINER